MFDGADQQAMAHLRSLDMNRMTPMQAWEALRVLQEMLQEKASVDAVFREPGNKCRVRRGKSDKAKEHVDRFRFHRECPFLADS